jgi:hypothetical protein
MNQPGTCENGAEAGFPAALAFIGEPGGEARHPPGPTPLSRGGGFMG